MKEQNDLTVPHQHVMQPVRISPLTLFSLLSVLFAVCWWDSFIAAVEVDACVLAWTFSCLISVTCSDHDDAWGNDEREEGAGIIPCGCGEVKHRSGEIILKSLMFTHLLVLGPSVMLLFGVEIFTGCLLAVGVFRVFVWNVSDLLIELWCFTENVCLEGFVFEERFADLKPHGSGLTDLLLRNSRCLFSFRSFFISFVLNSLVGLRHDVTLLRPRRCSCFSALISTIRSKSFTGESCIPLTTRVSMAKAQQVTWLEPWRTTCLYRLAKGLLVAKIRQIIRVSRWAGKVSWWEWESSYCRAGGRSWVCNDRRVCMWQNTADENEWLGADWSCDRQPTTTVCQEMNLNYLYWWNTQCVNSYYLLTRIKCYR